MRKVFFICLFLLLLTGCSSKGENFEVPDDYLITYNAIDIKPGTFFNNVLATLGEYNHVREVESSYIDGTASVYEYDTFEIETYIENNIEKIAAIAITSDEQFTNEGLKLGDSVERMKELYGVNFEMKQDNIYAYKTSDTNILFVVENGIIVGIVYNLV